MEVSRLSFTKKTQENTKKNMSVREKGKILFARLQELDEDGTLSRAKTRTDVARLVGYPRERAKAGYAWVSNLIRRGHMTETIRGYSPSGVADCEYHLAGSHPDYGYEEQGRRRARKTAVAKMAEEAVRQGLVEQMPVLDNLVAQTKMVATKVEITKGDMIIKVEFAEVEQATNLITTIMKGE